MYIWTLGNTHWSVVDNAWCRWLWVPAGARPGAHAAWGRAGLLGCVPQMNWGFSHYGCVFFFLFSFLLTLREKKTLWLTQTGFLHDNTDTVNHAWAPWPAPPPPPVVQPIWCHWARSPREASTAGQSGQNTHTQFFKWTAMLPRTRRQWHFKFRDPSFLH